MSVTLNVKPEQMDLIAHGLQHLAEVHPDESERTAELAAELIEQITAGHIIEIVADRRLRRSVVLSLTVLGVATLSLIVSGAAVFMGVFDTELQLPPCATEDSSNCFWDADEHGNGGGSSFIDIDGVTYIEAGE